MINHARTLLLNASGATRQPTTFLEEYIDPKYAALELPNYLQLARAALFNTNADDAYKNYIMRVCMTILHSTEFASYVYALDPRVTYLNRPAVTLTRTSLSAMPLNDKAALGAADLSGTPMEDKQRAQWDWIIEVLSGGPVLFTVQATLRQPYVRQQFNINFDSGFSDLLPLPGQNTVFFRFKDTMTVGMSWGATAFIMPSVDLPAMLAGFSKNGDVAGQLFGNAEPLSVFKELWTKHVYLNYKLSGYLLALIYRTEEVRQNGTR